MALQSLDWEEILTGGAAKASNLTFDTVLLSGELKGGKVREVEVISGARTVGEAVAGKEQLGILEAEKSGTGQQTSVLAQVEEEE
jgi:hypothetical protein